MWPAIEPLTMRQNMERAAETQRRLRRLFPRLNVHCRTYGGEDLQVNFGGDCPGFDGTTIERRNWHPETAVMLLAPEILVRSYPRGWARA